MVAVREQMIQNSESFQVSLEDAKKTLVDLHAHTEDSRTTYEKGAESLNNLYEQFLNVLSGAKEKESQILSQEKAITDLRGLAADAALGGVFGKRRQELEAPVLRWIWISIASFIVAIGWISYVLKDYTDIKITTINWPILLVNFFRTSPAVALVFFCLSQFSKERNLQEEYAFKAAVSMTVTAYSSMIDKEDERIKMLISAIQGVYVPPAIGKPFSIFSFKTKHIAEASKNAVEVAKSMQTAVSDVTKAVNNSDKDDKSDKGGK